jgi:hypothetical protein
MLISTEKQFLFVANTKTASTSIEHALIEHAEIHRGGSPARKHIGIHQVYHLYDVLFSQPAHHPDRYFKFGVMREPLDWISSWFRYRKGNQVAAPLPAEMTFEAFWQQQDWNIRTPEGWKYLQRHLFCAPAGGPVLMDVIIPYPQLEAMFAEICAALGVKATLSRQNVSTWQAADVIPAHLHDELRAFYAPDYQLWEQLGEINAVGMAKVRRQKQG